MSGEDFVQEDDQGLVEFARPIQNLEAPRVEFAQPAVGETEVFLFIPGALRRKQVGYIPRRFGHRPSRHRFKRSYRAGGFVTFRYSSTVA